MAQGERTSRSAWLLPGRGPGIGWGCRASCSTTAWRLRLRRNIRGLSNSSTEAAARASRRAVVQSPRLRVRAETTSSARTA